MTLLTKTFTVTALTSALAFTALPSLAADYDFPHIETTGASEIVIDADMAVVNIEVVVDAPTSKAAKDASDKAISQFLSRLKQAGVDKHDIQSANLSLHPQYDYQKNEPAKLKGYQASRRMTITVKQLEQLNDLLDSALEQGINRVNSIELTSSKRADFIEQARQAAIEDAKQKAQSLAKGFDKKVEGVWQVRYYDQHPIQPMQYKMAAQADNGAAESYQQGQVTISDRVEVVFKLK